MKYLSYISESDAYEVRLESMLASYDRDILTSLYQPIVGYSAVALYFTLWSEFKHKEFSSIKKHDLLMKVMGITGEELLKARQKLEGIGLLRTYQKKLNKKTNIFLYELYAPKSPNDFFADPIYKVLLSEKIGKKEVEKLSLIYKEDHKMSPDYEEISSSFKDTYRLNSESFMENLTIKSTRGRKSITLKSDFDSNKFLQELQLSKGILHDSLTVDELKEIERLSLLFGLDMMTMIELVDMSYDINSEIHLNTQMLLSLCNKHKSGINIDLERRNNPFSSYEENDQLGVELNLMSETAPFEYLKLRQNYTNPAPSDVNVINVLSNKYNFTPGVINAIIHYTLVQCDDKLPLNYVEKVAATLARKKVTTALAAVNALKSGKAKKDNNDVIVNDEETQEVYSQEDIAKMMEDL